MPISYNVYANNGLGGPIDFSAPVATVASPTWTSGDLAAPGAWSFSVRAANANGEEQNLDCAVTIVLDGNGADITNRPAPPAGLRAFATAGGGVRVEWSYPPTRGPGTPAGFHVYIGTGTPNYAAPVSAVPYSTGILSRFVANLAGLSGGTTYAIGVRSFNAVAEEANTATVSVTADSAGPLPVTGLTAVAIA